MPQQERSKSAASALKSGGEGEEEFTQLGLERRRGGRMDEKSWEATERLRLRALASEPHSQLPSYTASLQQWEEGRQKRPSNHFLP